MRLAAAGVVVGLGLASCAQQTPPYVWNKAGVDVATYRGDADACFEEAQAVAFDQPEPSTQLERRRSTSNAATTATMELPSRTYRQVSYTRAPTRSLTEIRNEAFEECLFEEGYRRAPLSEAELAAYDALTTDAARTAWVEARASEVRWVIEARP